jgi:hypothetical protein
MAAHCYRAVAEVRTDIEDDARLVPKYPEYVEGGQKACESLLEKSTVPVLLVDRFRIVRKRNRIDPDKIIPGKIVSLQPRVKVCNTPHKRLSRLIVT